MNPLEQQNPEAAPQQDAKLPGPPAALDPLSGMVAGWLQHSVQQVQNNPIVAAKNKAANDALTASAKPVDESSASRPAPGSFADKLAGAFSGTGDSLGGGLADAAHANDRPGGWLSGVLNTVAARKQRLEQEQKDAALLAKTQAETVALHRNMYLQDAALRAASYKANQDFANAYKVNHDIEEVSHDELMKRSKSDSKFAEKYFVRATSEEPMLDAQGLPEKDKNGNPITTPTYSIITRATKDGQPDDKTVSDSMSADMKKYLGQTMPTGTKLTGLQYAALDTALNSTRNAVNILENANGKAFSDEQMKSLAPYLTDPTIQAAISHSPGNAYAGLKQYMNNADQHIDALQGAAEQAKQQKNQAVYDQVQQQIATITEEKNKVSQFAATAITPKQVEEYDKDQNKGTEWVDKMLHDPNILAGDKAASAIPQLQNALQQATDPILKTKIGQAISVAEAAQKNYFNDQKRKAEADQLAKQGSPDAAGDALAKGLVTLADLKTRGTTQDFILQAIAAARKIDSTYNPADEVNYEHIAKSPQTAQFFGSAKSLLEKDGTLDQLIDIGKRVPDNSLPALNKLEDWEELARGKGPLAGYAALILGVADDYGKVMGGGTASDRARDHALALFAAAQTPEQRMEAVQATLGAVNSQVRGRIGKNKFLQREYGDFDQSQYTPPLVSKRPENAPSGAVQDPDRPQGYNAIRVGSDGKAYYYNSQTNHVVVVPENKQKQYLENK